MKSDILPGQLHCPGLIWTHELLILSEGVAEVTAVTIWAGNTSKDHPADLRLVAWVSNHRAELLNPMCKLAVFSVRAFTGLLPFVAEFGLEHALVVHLQFKWLLLLHPSSRNVHLLLHQRDQCPPPSVHKIH